MTQPLPTELKSEAVAALLGVKSCGKLYSVLSQLPRRRLDDTPGAPPWMYRTEHVLQIRKVMDEVPLRATAAIRVVAAQLEQRI